LGILDSLLKSLVACDEDSVFGFSTGEVEAVVDRMTEIQRDLKSAFS